MGGCVSASHELQPGVGGTRVSGTHRAILARHQRSNHALHAPANARNRISALSSIEWWHLSDSVRVIHFGLSAVQSLALPGRIRQRLWKSTI
jgi:hypothetical protein